MPSSTATRNAIAMIAICGAGCSPADAESGQALDWTTKAPIAGAEITLDCYRDPWFSGHGHVHLRTVTHITDADGRYSFGIFDRIGCTLTTFIVKKAGYDGAFPSPPLPTFGNAVPKNEIVIKASDRVFFDLQQLVPDASVRTYVAATGAESAMGNYTPWFEAFFKAKRMATTPREIAYVHEHFCAELVSRYVKLSDEDKESLKHYGVTYNYGGKQDHGMLSGYAAEVVPYCGDH
ncbi:MAG: hypothetical protein ACLPV8_06500 [Steroidobacteraceae bacterium]